MSGEHQRTESDAGGHRGQNHGGPGGPEFQRTVSALVGAMHHVNGTIDADPDQDWNREEVRDVETHAEHRGGADGPEQSDDQNRLLQDR